MWQNAGCDYLKLQHITEPIYGVLVDREFDEYRIFYLIETLDGPVIRLTGGIDLQQKMDKANPDDYVRINFRGWKALANGRHMTIADVEIRRRQPDGGYLLVTEEKLENPI